MRTSSSPTPPEENMLKRSAAGILASLVFTSTQSAALDVTITLPRAVEKHLGEGCGGGEKLAITPSFITATDINGDGITDYILNYGYAGCGGAIGSSFCGTGGCSLSVFLGTKNDAVLALDDLSLGYKIYRYKGYAVAEVQGKYGQGIMKLTSKKPETLKSLPSGGKLVGN